MLTRWVNVTSERQTVRFKYFSKDDYEAIVKSQDNRKKELYKQKQKLVANSPEWKGVETELMKLELAEYYKKRLKDLEDGKIVQILHLSFCRAKEAAQKALYNFDHIKFTGLLKSYLELRILTTYFCGASEKHITDIRDTFAKTAQGLSSDVTISDCAGRERVGGTRLAEGIVPLKKDKQKELNERGAALSPIDQQLLMRKYLESGATNSIHVEFSYLDSYSIDAMARIILHEATHKYAATVDFGYEEHKSIEKLKPELAVLNADSYAYAGISVLRKRLIRYTDLQKEKPAISYGDKIALKKLEDNLEYSVK